MALAAIQRDISDGKLVQHSGILKVRSKAIPWWRKRHCALEGCKLTCTPLPDIAGLKQPSEWTLQDVTQWNGIGRAGFDTCAFACATNGDEELQIMASTASERDTWLAAISLALEQAETEAAGPAASPRGRISQWRQLDEPEDGPAQTDDTGCESRKTLQTSSRLKKQREEPFVRILLGDIGTDCPHEPAGPADDAWVDVSQADTQPLSCPLPSASEEWVEC